MNKENKTSFHLEFSNGYKKIKNKVIPENWEIKNIGSILKVKHGKSQKEVEDIEGKYPILATGGIIGRTNSFLYNKPSVLLGRKGTIDRPQYIEEPFWTVDTLFYTEIKENYYPKWIYYKFCTIPWKKYNEATGVPSLSASTIQSIKIEIPTYLEQKKIASILSTWDKAIELKEKLIEQKKKQKKGLMQKLLTGEVRLPGFEGKWRSLRILNFCNTYSGGTPSRTRKEFYENGTIPWIKSGELNSRKVTQTEEYITEKALANSTAKLVNPETILLALYGATAGVVAMSKIRASINQAILAIVPNDNCDNNFLFYYLENHMDKVTKKYTQGGQPNLNADIVKKMVVKLPSIEEQKAIANILSNIDNNIELLEKELNWLKQQKKGLMQLLLTGKVRVKV